MLVYTLNVVVVVVVVVGTFQMIEMKLFADINKMHPIESMTLEANTLSPEMETKKGWLRRLFRFKRQVRI